MMKKIGGYTVASCIGKGRYGVCFLAYDPDGKKVVLKKFRMRMWKRNRNANHYEAVILSGLAHPAVPELLGVINNRKGYFFVLGYKEGRTLSEWLFNEKRVFSKEEIFQIGCQVFEILIYLHRRNVVHGDISVANVIYDGENISLLDFGLARFADRRNIRFSLDYARAADVLLYLLYSLMLTVLHQIESVKTSSNVSPEPDFFPIFIKSIKRIFTFTLSFAEEYLSPTKFSSNCGYNK